MRSTPGSAVAITKMHGLGNDVVILDARAAPMALDAATVARIADRRRGVGCDQLAVVVASTVADAGILWWNADGSPAGACGNGTRCVARLLMDEAGVEALTLETAGGVLSAAAAADGWVRVGMAAPRFGWRDVPLGRACDTDALPLAVPGLPAAAGLSLGNPHAVFVVADVAAVDVAGLGARIEVDPLFPDRANVGFAQVLDDGSVRLRVWERGAGLTQACGSGACAAAVTAIRRGLVRSPVRLRLDGGDLEIAWDGAGPVAMGGPAAYSFHGTLAAELLG